ncbi:MAG: hypothetical protein IPM88_20875 [Nitrospira sp.]|nr:hypothetical protein [Nitrospira sp.]
MPQPRAAVGRSRIVAVTRLANTGQTRKSTSPRIQRRDESDECSHEPDADEPLARPVRCSTFGQRPLCNRAPNGRLFVD